MKTSLFIGYTVKVTDTKGTAPNFESINKKNVFVFRLFVWVSNNYIYLAQNFHFVNYTFWCVHTCYFGLAKFHNKTYLYWLGISSAVTKPNLTSNGIE